MRTWFGSLSFSGLLGLSSVLAWNPACSGASQPSRSSATGKATTENSPARLRPHIRLLVVSNVAGALEPCGCRKNMLGGAPRLAALLEREAPGAEASFFLGAGPLWATNPAPLGENREQELWKAEALADILRRLSLVAWAPGANDWAWGEDTLDRLTARSGARLLASNLHLRSSPPAGGSPQQNSLVIERKGLRVGLVGATEPFNTGLEPEDRTPMDPLPAITQGLRELQSKKTDLRILLLAMDRGKALRLVEHVRGFDILVLGSSQERGTSDRAAAPLMRVGHTLVVESPNHLQGLAELDLFVGDPGALPLSFQDLTADSSTEVQRGLERRIMDLRKRLAEWDRDPSVSPADRLARHRDLKHLEEQQRLKLTPRTRLNGNFYQYSILEVGESVGATVAATKRVQEYYKKVNSHNREAFRDRVPLPAEPGKSRYVGVESCSTCHPAAREFWNRTRHGNAYASLVKRNAEFNLDCVGCHVTGYEKPGGSSVIQVNGLTHVQCENCHGPGSLHAESPGTPALIQRAPAPTLCAELCHHPPHVPNDWSYALALPQILGPGHGAPEAL